MIRPTLSSLAVSAVLGSALLGPGATARAQGMFGTYAADPAAATGGTYALDKTHASVAIRITHMGLSHYALRFRAIDGSFTYDPKAPAASKISVTIDPKSIETFDPKFNEEIATKFFEADKYPTISFVSTSVSPARGGRGQVAGQLTFHGVTRPVVLDVAYNGARLKMMGQTRMGFSATTTIKRSDFGIAGSMPAAVLSDDLPVTIEAEFVSKPAA